MSDINANSKVNFSDNQKPINLGMDVTSWNYGCFYQIPSYCNSKIQSKKENISSVSNQQKDANSNIINKNVSTTKEKIIKDDYLKNMNLLKIIGTNKNISNKPVKIVNPISNKVVLNKTLNIKNTKNDNNDIKDNTIHGEESLSQIKFGLKYEDWLEIKKEQSLIDQNLKMLKQQEIEKINEFKKRVKKEYEPIRNTEFNNWINKKKEQNKQKLREKINKKRDQELKEEQKKLISEEKLNNWMLRQAINMEKENTMKKMKEDNERRIKEQEENYKKLRNSDAKKAFGNWLLRKEQERLYNEQLKSMGLLTEKNNTKRQPESRASNSVKYKLVIGPYSNAKILRDMKTQVENQLNNIETYMNERENYDQNDQEFDDQENIENDIDNENKIHSNNDIGNNDNMDNIHNLDNLENEDNNFDENEELNKEENIQNDNNENDIEENVDNDNNQEFNDLEFDEEYYNNLNDEEKEVYFYNQLRMKGYTDDQIEQLRNAQYENYEENN